MRPRPRRPPRLPRRLHRRALTRGGGANDALAWLGAIGHRTVDLLLAAVGRIAALSALGAKQLAADAAYVDNILQSLSVQEPRLAELGRLLTASAEELPAAVAAATVLPADLVAAIAAKRGLV